MAFAMLVKLCWVLAIYFLIAGVFRIVHLIRARAMRAFAARLGFEYIGPGAPPNSLCNSSMGHLLQLDTCLPQLGHGFLVRHSRIGENPCRGGKAVVGGE
jgi:hypothetical protein